MIENISNKFIDLEFYAAANPELGAAGVDTPEELLSHLQSFGVMEGRTFSPFADLDYYRQSYPELGSLNNEQLFEHLQTVGISEGRRLAPTVDLEFYADSNPDISTTFGNDFSAILDHLRGFGVEEAREFVRGLNLAGYLELNPDVNARVGSDLQLALEDMLLSGIEQNLPGALPSLAADSFQIQTVQQFYPFLGFAPDQALELLAPDIVIDFVGEPNRLPLAGTFEGLEGVTQWREAQSTLEIFDFKDLEYLQDGNQVAVRIVEQGAPRRSNVPYTLSPTHIFTLNQDGQVSSWDSFYNSYIFNQAYQGFSVEPIPQGAPTGQEVITDSSADSETSRQIAEGFWNAIATGQDVSAFLAPDVVWSFPVSPGRDILPYVGVFNGPQGVAESLAGYNQIATPGQRTVVNSFADGNRVLVQLREEDATIRSNNNEYDLDIFSWITVDENGQISSVENILDNNAVVRALRPGETYPLPSVPRTNPPFVLVPDIFQQVVLAYDEGGNFIGIFGEATNQDTGLTSAKTVLGPNGNYYISDQTSNNWRVLEFNGVSGDLIGVFGEANTEDSGLRYPTDMEFGPDGNFYVSSGLTSQILRYDGSTGEFLGVAAQRDNGFPDNIIPREGRPPDFTFFEFGTDGVLYVGSLEDDPDGNPDNGTGSILRYTGPFFDNPGEPLGVFGDSSSLAPFNLDFGPDNNLYVFDGVQGKIYSLSGPDSNNPGELLGVFADLQRDVAAGSGFQGFTAGLEFGPDDNLYVAVVELPPNRVETVVYSGPETNSPGTFLGSINDANALITPLVPGPGNVVIPASPGSQPEPGTMPFLVTTNLASPEVVTYDRQGNFTGVFGEANSSDSNINVPNLLTVGPDGDVYVNSVGNNQVLRYDGTSGQFLGTFGDATNEASGLLYPTGITFGPDNNLYVSSGATSQVLRYDGSTGQFLGEAAFRNNGFPNNTVDPLPPPPDFTDVEFGPDGNMYVISLRDDPDGNPENGTGTIRVYGGPNSNNFGEFLGLFGEANTRYGLFAFGPDGNLYVSDFDPSLPISVFAGPNSDNPGQSLGLFADLLDEVRANYEGEVEGGRIAGIKFGRDGNLYVGVVGFDPVIGGSLTSGEPQNISQMYVYGGPSSNSPGQILGTFGGTDTLTDGRLIRGSFDGEFFEPEFGDLITGSSLNEELEVLAEFPSGVDVGESAIANDIAMDDTPADILPFAVGEPAEAIASI